MWNFSKKIFESLLSTYSVPDTELRTEIIAVKERGGGLLSWEGGLSWEQS